MLKVASLKPPSSVGTSSMGSNFQLLDFGVAAVHFVEVAGEEGGLVAAGAGADFEDQAGVVGPGGTVVDEVAEGVADLGLAGVQAGQLGLGVGSHFGVGLGLLEGLGLGDLAAEFEVAAVGDGDAGEGAAFTGEGSDAGRVGGDLRVAQGLVDGQEALIVGLELFEHGSRRAGERKGIAGVGRAGGYETSRTGVRPARAGFASASGSIRCWRGRLRVWPRPSPWPYRTCPGTCG